MTDLVRRFSELYPFPLDSYQVAGCRALADGSGVLVAAPTGAGKTVVGEFAVWLALETGLRCFYTTPIKALSNQKFHDLVERHGVDNVGLLTGDVTVNGDAAVVVMTTEVLRNMIYAGSTGLNNLGHVVMDEVHYLADRFRGAVWEEVILGLAPKIQVTALSATVSNVEDFGDWLATVRGRFEVVVSERRPVPLFQHMLVGSKLVDLFEGVAPTAQEVPSGRVKVNRELLKVSRSEAMRVRDDSRRPRGRSGRGKNPRGSGAFGGDVHPRFAGKPTSRAATANLLARSGLLPAICFIFSRAGCQAAVEQLLASGVDLTSRDEAAILGEIADRHVAGLSSRDLDALGYEDFRQALCAGYAAHHAGQLPAFKAIIEEGFATGACKLVFATETLALGINMPARTVLLERLAKYNGEAVVDITPGEYTQLTGRAGRRGIDVEGHAVVQWQSGMDPRAVAGLASRRTYPLRSSFSPSYNMAVNLVATVGRERAREVLNQCFAQYVVDKSVVSASRAAKGRAGEIAELRERSACHLGDFMTYAALRDEISQLESTSAAARRARRADDIADAISSLQGGDIIHVRRLGWCAVLSVSVKRTRDDVPWVQVIALDHTVIRLRPHDFNGAPVSVGRVRVPRRFSVQDRKARRELLSALGSKLESIDPKAPVVEPTLTDEVHKARIAELRHELKHHPCHPCEERELHAVAAASLLRLERDAARAEAALTGKAQSLGVQFDRVCGVLSDLGYLDGDQLTDTGRMLRRIYNELDLVAAECIRRDVFAGLDAPQLAAVLSSLLYESRPSRDARRPRMPDAASEAAQSALRGVWREVGVLERNHHRDRGREPDIGFAEAAWRWASGQELAKVLFQSGLPAGDFVRWVRQVVDLAGQLAMAAGPGDFRRTCREVVAAMRRGVVDTDPEED